MEPLQVVATALIQQVFKSAWSGVTQVPQWVKDKLSVGDPFRVEASSYAVHVVSQYNSMRIIGMEQPVPLDDIYINVNIRDQRTRQPDFDSDFWEWRASEDLVEYRQRSVPAINAVAEHEKLLVLGRPGAGKTTFLKYLAIASLRQQLKTKLLPVFVSLKEWSRTPDKKLETVLIQQFDVCNLSQPREFVKKLLRDGKCLVLLDAFDEIEAEHRSKGISQIESLIQQFPRSRFVLSCRTAANTYVFPGFTEVEIADFDDVQIQKFVRKWFDGSVAEKCIKELQAEDSRGLRDLARNPLLLTLLCIAYGESHSFPESRVALYEMALDALLKKWDSSRNVVRFNPYKHLTLQRKELLFGRIAATGFEHGLDIYALKDLAGAVDRFMIELAPGTKADADDILDAIEAQHGIIVKVQPGEYRFSHLTFQEFYTGRHVVDSADSTLIARVLEAHMGEPRWNEVLLIVGGLHKDASHYIWQLKTTLDKLRDHHVDRVLNLARANIRNPNAFSHTVNVILALTQLLKDATHGVDARALQATTDFADLTARRVCEMFKVSIRPDVAMLEVTQLGFAKHRDSLQEAVSALKRDAASWQSLQRFFIGMHVLMGCLAGEALVPVSYRDAIMAVLFSPGGPSPPMHVGSTLFSS